MIYRNDKAPWQVQLVIMSDYDEEVLLDKVNETKWEATWDKRIRNK